LLSYSVNMKNLAGLVANTVLLFYASGHRHLMGKALPHSSKRYLGDFSGEPSMRLYAYGALLMPNSKFKDLYI
jgi:hypothetical protein